MLTADCRRRLALARSLKRRSKKAARRRPLSTDRAKAQGLAGGVSDCFLAASVAALAASSAEDALGDGAAADGAGRGGAGAGAGAAARRRSDDGRRGSSFLPQAVSAAAAISEAIRTGLLHCMAPLDEGLKEKILDLAPVCRMHVSRRDSRHWLTSPASMPESPAAHAAGTRRCASRSARRPSGSPPQTPRQRSTSMRCRNQRRRPDRARHLRQAGPMAGPALDDVAPHAAPVHEARMLALEDVEALRQQHEAAARGATRPAAPRRRRARPAASRAKSGRTGRSRASSAAPRPRAPPAGAA